MSINRVLNKEHFLWKNHAENMHQKLVPDPFFISVYNLKHNLHARNSFKNKILSKGDYRKPFKKLTLFFLSNQIPFNGQLP